MAEIRKLGWAGAWFALGIFAAGFLAGSIFHHATMPTAIIAVAPPAAAKLPTSNPNVELSKLAEDVSEIRKELTKMNLALQRIEASLRKR